MSREAEIRRELIDKRLAEAGWSAEKRNLVNELFLSSHKGQVKEQSSAYELALPEHVNSLPPDRKFADYALLGSDQQPIAIVEAKHDGRSPLEGQEQAAEYADLIYSKTGKRPFIFLSNGDKTYFWDSERYPPREVSGFYTVKGLEDLASLRQYNQPLHRFQPDSAIIDREYQQRAVQAVIDGIKQKKRKFLLVMQPAPGRHVPL